VFNEPSRIAWFAVLTFDEGSSDQYLNSKKTGGSYRNMPGSMRLPDVCAKAFLVARPSKGERS
jgi:hypothetical protein